MRQGMLRNMAFSGGILDDVDALEVDEDHAIFDADDSGAQATSIVKPTKADRAQAPAPVVSSHYITSLNDSHPFDRFINYSSSRTQSQKGDIHISVSWLRGW